MPPDCVKGTRDMVTHFLLMRFSSRLMASSTIFGERSIRMVKSLMCFSKKRRDAKAANRFFKRMLKKHKGEPRKIVTDKLTSYRVAHRELIPELIHDTSKYANNRAELSHQPTRVRERVMRKFKSVKQAQRFLNAHAAVYNLFNLGRHLVSAKNYRYFRSRAFASWEKSVAV